MVPIKSPMPYFFEIPRKKPKVERKTRMLNYKDVFSLHN